jgi:hypothetical protein
MHTSKLVKSYIVLALGFLLLAGIPAVAAPIDPAITVTGSVTYDTGYSFVDNASQSGAMTRTIGGSTTTTTYSASSPGVMPGSTIGSNPLSGTLTDTGDGFGVAGTASAPVTPDDGEFAVGIDIAMTITNNSATDVFQVTIVTTFGNTVDSFGGDAYVDSEFTLDQRLSSQPAPGTEEFFTALFTDTVNGNEVGGVPVPGFGGPLTDIGVDTLVLTLNPGESYIVEGDWTMEGGAYDSASGAFLDEFYVNLAISDVTPEPATLLLLTLGGMVVQGRRRRRSSK